MEVEPLTATLEVRRPLSYAEIVASNPAIDRSVENVATTTTTTLPTLQHQSNTLPRPKRRGRGGGNFGAGTGTNRFRTYSGSNQDKAEPARTRQGSFSGTRGGGRGGARGGGHPTEKPQFQGGISRDNPQFHTFPRSRRRQPPDPERYTANRGAPHVGPSQRRILNRKAQLQKEQQREQEQQQPDENEQQTEDLTFSQILVSKAAATQHQPEQQQQHHDAAESHNLTTRADNTTTTTATATNSNLRSYASTLATGLDLLLHQRAALEQRKPVSRTDAASVYKSQPILVLRDPWSDQPPPPIPGLRFRTSQPLERRNSKKQKQSQVRAICSYF